MVTCGSCEHFIPDPIGFGGGIGQCKIYNARVAAHGSKVAPPRGRCLFPLVERTCSQHQLKTNKENET